MADKSVGELIAATSVTPTDLFVLEQNGTAKKLTGQTLENWLVSFADGHGGIQSIVKIETNVLADTYRITLADTTTFDFVVTNGRGVSSIDKKSTSGLVDTYTIIYNDGTSGTFTVTNGEKGDKGDTAYIWVKYASQKPTEDSHSFGDVPDDWIGVYFGFSDTAPTDWQQYSWYKIKGIQGDTGNPATLISSAVTYQTGDSGTVVPSGDWSGSIPAVPQGKYLWTREVTQFNTGDPITKYSVSRMGLDGLGSVVSVNNVSPNENGNVTLNASDVGALPIGGGTMEGSINMNGQKLLGLNNPADDTEAVNRGYVLTLTKNCAHWNLLDNSNFANPINQRGAASYTGTVYTIDRWRSRAAGFTIVVGNSKISATLADSHTADYAALMQYVPREKIKAGEKYTLACCTDSGKIYCFVVTAQSETAAGTLNPVGDNAYLELAFDGTNYRFNMNVIRGRTISLLWAALYEGEYTLETLPKYQSKGYGVELLECQRYYQIRSTNNIAAVDMRPTMRLSSPTITSVTGGYAYSADL